MIATQTTEFLKRLKAGAFDPADVEALERASMNDLLAELDSAYRFRFQERHLRDKWEFGMARSLRFELVSFAANSRRFPILCVMPVYRHCLFLSGERAYATGISIANSLRIRPVRKPIDGLALTLSPGFKLDRLPDGWAIKPLIKRTVKLSDEFLRKRGWRFDTLQSLLPCG